jgi:hypothetical protein
MLAEMQARQVACGACHTLVLFSGKVYVLGSGLDLQARVSNLKARDVTMKRMRHAVHV